MANANDIITYIGVPLAVAGVLPLLWNMLKSLWIRLKLLESIPREYRRSFSLITDPAAGNVTVVGRPPRLAQPGLWSPHGSVLHSGSENWLKSDWMHAMSRTIVARWQSLTQWISQHQAMQPNGPVAHPLTDLMPKDLGTESPKPRADHVLFEESKSYHSLRRSRCTSRRKARVLYRWMQVTLSCGFDICKSVEEPDDLGDEVRFFVDADMRVEPMPLAMTWAQFIWFALGLGVDVHDPNLTISGSELKDQQGTPVLKTFKREDKFVVKVVDRNWEFSIRRALSNGRIIVAGNSDDDGTLLCKELRSRPPFPLHTLEAFSWDNPPAFRPANNEGGIVRRQGLSIRTLLLREEFPGSSKLQSGKDSLPWVAVLVWSMYHGLCEVHGDRFAVGQDLLVMQERSLVILNPFGNRGGLRRSLSSALEDEALAADVWEVLADQARRSPYFKATERLKQGLLIFRERFLTTQRRLDGASTTINDDSAVNDLRIKLAEVQDELSPYFLPRYTDQLMQRLKTNKHFTEMLSAIDADLQARTDVAAWSGEKMCNSRMQQMQRFDDDKDSWAVLGPTLLALFDWHAERRGPWILDSNVKENVSKLTEALAGKPFSTKPSFHAEWQEMHRLIGKCLKSTEKGAYRAPPSPLPSILNEPKAETVYLL